MITSTQNLQVKQVMRLLEKAKVRREHRLFVAEGRKMLLEAPDQLVQTVYVSEACLGDEALMKRVTAFPYEVVSEAVFAKMSDTVTPQGVLTVLREPAYGPKSLFQEGGLYVVLENIQDPGNLGTIFRTAEAAGVNGIFLTKGCADLMSPKVIRSTMGSIYRVKFFHVEDVPQAALFLRSWGVKLYAAHLKGEASYWDTSYLSGTAFVIGNEGNGLTEEAAREADALIKIPMLGQTESLNAAMACGILCYKAAEQRVREKSR